MVISLFQVFTNWFPLLFSKRRIFLEKPAVTAAFNEELFRRAVLRESELMDAIRILKSEVNSLRSRQSILSSARKLPLSGSRSNTDLHASSPRKESFSSTNGLEILPPDHIHSPSSRHEVRDVSAVAQEDAEREQRLVYLKQAFCGFFKAKHTVEMQHLARVICAILGVSVEEQEVIMENIIKLSPAVVATSTLEMFSQQFANIFN